MELLLAVGIYKVIVSLTSPEKLALLTPAVVYNVTALPSARFKLAPLGRSRNSTTVPALASVVFTVIGIWNKFPLTVPVPTCKLAVGC